MLFSIAIYSPNVHSFDLFQLIYVFFLGLYSYMNLSQLRPSHSIIEWIIVAFVVSLFLD